MKKRKKRMVSCYLRNSYSLIAFLIFATRSAGGGFRLWTLFACSVIFFISSSLVGAEASKGQSIPMSRHLKEGKKSPSV